MRWTDGITPLYRDSPASPGFTSMVPRTASPRTSSRVAGILESPVTLR
jgi:hypothetical protein